MLGALAGIHGLVLGMPAQAAVVLVGDAGLEPAQFL